MKEKAKTIVLKISDNTKKEMIDYFKDKKRDKTPPYAVFQADEMDTVVTLYNSNKVMFQGISADIDANMWKEREKHLNPGSKPEVNKKKKEKPKEKEDLKKYYYSSSIGSDEVGTGDFYGPIVVTAAYVKKEDIPFLEELGVKDSKKLGDDKIVEISQKIKDKIPYSTIILSNEKLNQKYKEYPNMNKIKAIMHNKALLNLSKKYKYDYIIVDEFTSEKSYYNYLKESTNVQKNIKFFVRGEDVSLAVACGAILSRYVLLKTFKEMEEKYKIKFPKGSSNPDIIKVGQEFVKKYGKEELKKVCKTNFKTYDKIYKC